MIKNDRVVMVKYLFLILFFLITFSSCSKSDTLFDLYSVPIMVKDEYKMESINDDMVNDILASLINVKNFHSLFSEDGISYNICDKLVPYNMDYFYHISDGMYYGFSKVIKCDYFICINQKNSLYTSEGFYVCEIVSHLIFNINGSYYQIPYTLKIKTDLNKVIDIQLLLSE